MSNDERGIRCELVILMSVWQGIIYIMLRIYTFYGYNKIRYGNFKNLTCRDEGKFLLTHKGTHTCVHVGVCVCVYVCARARIYIYICVCARAYIYIYIHTYIHTYIHIHIRVMEVKKKVCCLFYALFVFITTSLITHIVYLL
jgi:hypothetical protein